MNEEELKFKMELTENFHTRYRLVKLSESVERLVDNGNTERFCKIIAGKWVLINKATGRVENEYNPHIRAELERERCSNWRVDGWSWTHIRACDFNCRDTANYIVDFKNGRVTRVKRRGETVCSHCGAIIKKEQKIGRYCEKCLTEDGGLAYRFVYHSYGNGYTVYEKIDTSKNVVMGCEIERDYTGEYCSDFEHELKSCLLEAVKVLYGRELNNKSGVKRKYVFMRDGSLNNDGCEWITFPQTYAGYKRNKKLLDTALEIFKKHNFENSNCVGNHIHINRDYFGSYQQSRYCACKLAVLFSKFWEELKAIARRENTDYTEKPRHEVDDDIFTLVDKTNEDQDEHSVAVNTQHYNTIEIRLWAGIDNADDLLLFLDITRALARFVKKKSVESCQRAKFEDLFKYLGDKNEHIDMIIERLEDRGITGHSEKLRKLKGDSVCA